MTSAHRPQSSGGKPWSNWAFIGFLLIAGFFLLAEHRAHVFGVLPFVLLALCPLMHLFGHGGHGGHDHGADKKDKP
ncbi:MAG: DUF2933 domain-containing protein [Gammaproteobacteria bacterium]|nr:DUF2933 domain-containing protein [Gammaproteobacteria bacterium]